MALAGAAVVVLGTAAQTPERSIWVVSASPQPTATQFDAANFNARRVVRIPKSAADHPEYLSVNRHGQLLHILPNGVQLGDAVDAASNVWYFNEGTKPPFARQASDNQPRMWFLDAQGDGLYALELRHTKTRNADGDDATISTTAQLLKRAANATALASVVTLPALPRCTCDTGACSESCPVWTLWAPEDGVGDFFLATRYVEGQLQSDYQSTLLYRRANDWKPATLSEAVESPLDATADGATIVASTFDGGCCGWANESSDQLRLLRNGKAVTVFDEFARYKNQDYDVSFAASRAKLSDSGALIAYTITASQSPSDEIRLSADGKDNADELARIKRTMATLPATEIVRVSDPARVIAVIPGELAGWLSENELLVVLDHKLVTYDALGTKARQSSIEARSAASVFVR